MKLNEFYAWYSLAILKDSVFSRIQGKEFKFSTLYEAYKAKEKEQQKYLDGESIIVLQEIKPQAYDIGDCITRIVI